MRILHVIPQLTLGGAEQVVLSLIRQQRRLGLDAQLVVLGSQNAFPERLTDLPEPAFLHYGGKRRDVVGFARCVARLRRLVRQQQPDIVHSHLWPASRLTGWAVRNRPTPHVVHIHDTRPWLAGQTLRDAALRRWTRISLPAARTHFLAVSEAVRQYTLEHLGPLTSTIEVCHNGIDPAVFADDEEVPVNADVASGRLTIGTAGRFAPEKGHADLIRAVAALRERGFDCTLRIAGDGQLRREYEQLTAKLGLESIVDLPGKVRDMPGFYRSLDIFALPSVGAEGLPITLLEAMAAGLPIVACDVAGVSEAVRDGVDGRLVPPGDHAALADALFDLAADEASRQRFAASAQQRVTESFSVAAMAERCGRLYDRLAVSAADTFTHAAEPGHKYG